MELCSPQMMITTFQFSSLPGSGPTRPVKQTRHNGILVSPHSTALHPHYMYSLTFQEKQSISRYEVKLQLLPHLLFFSPWLLKSMKAMVSNYLEEKCQQLNNQISFIPSLVGLSALTDCTMGTVLSILLNKTCGQLTQHKYWQMKEFLVILLESAIAALFPNSTAPYTPVSYHPFSLYQNSEESPLLQVSLFVPPVEA